ncbi:MAG TPA: M6 family metalloprotease domain-containing protein [Nitrospirota bacterium]|nr:M6 family metalloprotease domain-containing protein [Nitrospirota bacterium]
MSAVLVILAVFPVVLFSSPVFAAPHITGAKPEPARMIGTNPRARLALTRARAMYVPAQFPADIRVIFLRVDFQPETDPAAFQVTGSGVWLDPLYSQGSGIPADANDLNDPSNKWVNKSRTDFIRYWSEASYGALTITVDISPVVYRLGWKMSHYGSESSAALENLIYDSVTAAAADANPATRIDFTLYDAILVVHAGVGEETDIGNSSNDIWSLYYDGGGRICQNANALGPCLTTILRDGNVVGEGIIMPQTDSRDSAVVDPLGVYVHEFGHWLGLPDLYCTGRACVLDGAGKWSLMADGIYNADPSSQSDPSNPATCADERKQCIFGSSPASLDAWSRVFLGFAVPRTLDAGGGAGRMTLNPVENSAEIVKVQASSSVDSQYFLIENRQKTGFDKGLPGHGMLVWLVDDVVVNRNFATNSINNSKARPGIKLMEADNDWKLLSYGCGNTDDCGSAGDPFPGSSNNISFAPHTQPASRSYASFAWVNVRNIAENGEVVSADVGIGPLPPPLPGMNENTVVWQQSAEPGVAGYTVYRNGILLEQTTSTSYTDVSCRNGDAYQVAAIDAQGNESDFSGVVTANMQVIAGRGDSRCFIATAAWGTPLDPHVGSLRNFRDRHLLTNAAGRAFVAFYYRVSPPLAGFIGRHEGLRALTRNALTPVVYAVEYPRAAFLLCLIFTTALVLLRQIWTGRMKRKSAAG